MSEIVRTEQRTQKRNSSRTDGVNVFFDVTEIRTTVRSLHGHDVGVLRDFLAALHAADAPDTALVECLTQEGCVVRMSASWTTTPDSEGESA